MPFWLLVMEGCRYHDFPESESEGAQNRKAAERTAIKRSHKKHRNREEMIADILEASRNSATKTRIMNTCYISYNLLQKYLYYAIENGLLFCDSSNKYQATSKGIQYLDYFEQCRDTESELEFKKRLISEILGNNGESIMADFEHETNDMLPHGF